MACMTNMHILWVQRLECFTLGEIAEGFATKPRFLRVKTHMIRICEHFLCKDKNNINKRLW